jgi:hypothetical protein
MSWRLRWTGEVERGAGQRLGHVSAPAVPGDREPRYAVESSISIASRTSTATLPMRLAEAARGRRDRAQSSIV